MFNGVLQCGCRGVVQFVANLHEVVPRVGFAGFFEGVIFFVLRRVGSAEPVERGGVARAERPARATAAWATATADGFQGPPAGSVAAEEPLRMNLLSRACTFTSGVADHSGKG